MITKMIRGFWKWVKMPFVVSTDIDYLISRGWRYEHGFGWFQSYDPDLPKTSPFYLKNKESSKKGITLEEAMYYARHADMAYTEPLTPPASLGIDPDDDVWV